MKIRVCESGFIHYAAYDVDSYDGDPDDDIGLGQTPYAAVQDLRDAYQLSEKDEGIMACDIWLMANRVEV